MSKNDALMFDTPITEPLDFADPMSDNRYFQHKYYDELSECYKVVEDFIKRNKRILVGGMAIDFALKDRGSFLYKKNKIDYDFLSPEFHMDAYRLGEILAERFGHISVIGALHASTMRVRYKFMPVADITYMPLVFYDKIQTIDYLGFRCVHPHIQMIDQMRSIIYMAENPPRESFFGDRIIKDIKRFCMIANLYPIETGILKKDTISETYTYKVPAEFLTGNCLGGLAAGLFWLKKLKEPTYSLDFASSDKNVSITLPVGSPLTIYSDKPDDLIKLIESRQSNLLETKKYKAILDKMPEKTIMRYEKETYEIIDTSTSLLLAEKIGDYHVIHLYGVFMYLLILNAYDKQQDILGTFFNIVLKEFSNGLPSLSRNVIFYGTNNWSEPYLLSIKKHMPGFKPMLPKNAYPEKNKPVDPLAYTFDPTTSDILQKDGSQEGTP
jgi:hypothetical protein